MRGWEVQQLISNIKMYNLWRKFAQDNNYNIILILQDLEDRQLFPVYFYNEKELVLYQSNIISETRVKFIDVINITL
jgi:hypothetical protein